jgi:RNA polymerase sigma factor (sigma-70 family)
MSKISQHIHRAVLRHEGAGPTDGQLLESFLRHADESAFEGLLRRHGPMVWAVCRRVLGNHHDAEDAFQATFLVLLRKAASVVPREMVANWLHGVAHRTALKARTMAARRKAREKQVTEMPDLQAVPQDLWDDLRPLLDQELSRLPEKYRLVLLLCDLEGKSRKEAARQLGRPEGTVAGWLARARVMLAKRLARRGLALSSGAMAALLSKTATATVPASVVKSTMKAAAVFAAGLAASSPISARVAALVEEVLKTMVLTKLKTGMAILIGVCVAAFGGALLTHRTVAGEPVKTAKESSAASPGKDRAKEKLPAVTTDLDRLQGVWTVVSIESGGQLSKLENAVFMVDRKRACWQTRDGEMQGGLYLDPTREPKTFDLAMSPRTDEGIYALEGDSLRLCYVNGFDNGNEPKRPSRFATEPGSRAVLVVLKRTFGKEAFPYRLPDGTRTFPTLIERAALERGTPARPQLQPSGAKPARIGQIYVVGNTKTPTEVILKRMSLHPGQIIDYQGLQKVHENLAAFNAVITVLDGGDSAFKDILVQVREPR